jgi:hypothetical protein
MTRNEVPMAKGFINQTHEWIYYSAAKNALQRAQDDIQREKKKSEEIHKLLEEQQQQGNIDIGKLVSQLETEEKGSVSSNRRVDFVTVVIMSHLALEAFINRIGLEACDLDNPDNLSALNQRLKRRESNKFESAEDVLRYAKFSDKMWCFPQFCTHRQIFDKGNLLWGQLKKLTDERDKLVHAKPRVLGCNQLSNDILKNMYDTSELEELFNTVSSVVKYLFNTLGIPKTLTIKDFTEENPINGFLQY